MSYMSDDQFKQQVLESFETVNGRLNAIDQRLNGYDQRLDRHEVVLDRIASALVQKADASEMDARFDALDAKIDKIYNALDSFLKEQETDQQERLLANHQLDRHEDWISRAAPKLNIHYDAAS